MEQKCYIRQLRPRTDDSCESGQSLHCLPLSGWMIFFLSFLYILVEEKTRKNFKFNLIFFLWYVSVYSCIKCSADFIFMPVLVFVHFIVFVYNLPKTTKAERKLLCFRSLCCYQNGNGLKRKTAQLSVSTSLAH